MASVFLSYAREDRALVALLAKALERTGHRVLWDQQIAGGADWHRSIEAALARADVVLVAWSRAAVDSPWVRDEAAAGRDAGRLVPLTLDGTPPPLGFRQYQTIDFSGWRGRAAAAPFPSLRQTIDARLHPEVDHDVLSAPTTAATADEQARVSKEGQPRLRQLLKHQPVLFGGALALILAVAAFLFVRGDADALPDGPPPLRLGEFRTLSPDVPPGAAESFREELTSVFELENSVLVIHAPAASSNADHVLGGSVRKSGDTMHYTVHLRDERSGASLWSETFDRPTSFALAPRQVASKVNKVLRCGLLRGGAYLDRMSLGQKLAWFQFCGSIASEARVGLGVGLDATRKLTADLPDFSYGWAARALWAARAADAADGEEENALRAEAAETAAKALHLNPRASIAYVALAFIARPKGHAEQEIFFRKAVGTKPTDSANAHVHYGYFLLSVGRIEDALKQHRRAREIEPVTDYTVHAFAQSLMAAGPSAEADRYLTEALSVWPDGLPSGALLRLAVESAFTARNYDRALDALGRPEVGAQPAVREALAAAIQSMRDGGEGKAKALETLVRLSKEHSSNVDAVSLAIAALGDPQAALASVRARGTSRVLFLPPFAEARRHPAFAQLVNERGLMAYWRRTGHRPDFCLEPDAPPVCRSLS